MSESPSPPRPQPGHRAPAHAAPTEGRSRRWFLAGGGAVLLAAGAGVGAAFLRPGVQPKPDPAPDALVAALAAERALIADLDATTGGTSAVRRVLMQTRADHAAHLHALDAVAAGYDRITPATPTSAGSTGRPRTVAQLRAAEQRASAAAAMHAGRLGDRVAVLLASIAACEATHAELLR